MLELFLDIYILSAPRVFTIHLVSFSVDLSLLRLGWRVDGLWSNGPWDPQGFFVFFWTSSLVECQPKLRGVVTLQTPGVYIWTMCKLHFHPATITDNLFDPFVCRILTWLLRFWRNCGWARFAKADVRVRRRGWGLGRHPCFGTARLFILKCSRWCPLSSSTVVCTHSAQW